MMIYAEIESLQQWLTPDAKKNALVRTYNKALNDVIKKIERLK